MISLEELTRLGAKKLGLTERQVEINRIASYDIIRTAMREEGFILPEDDLHMTAVLQASRDNKEYDIIEFEREDGLLEVEHVDFLPGLTPEEQKDFDKAWPEMWEKIRTKIKERG